MADKVKDSLSSRLLVTESLFNTKVITWTEKTNAISSITQEARTQNICPNELLTYAIGSCERLQEQSNQLYNRSKQLLESCINTAGRSVDHFLIKALEE